MRAIVRDRKPPAVERSRGAVKLGDLVGLFCASTCRSGFQRGAGDGFGDQAGDAAIEDAGDDVVPVQVLRLDDRRDRVGGGQLHVIIDRPCANVQHAAE